MKEKTRISGYIPYSLTELKKLYRFSSYLKKHEKISKTDINIWLISKLINHLSELDYEYEKNEE